MVTVQNLTEFVGNGLINILFGDVIITGIVGTLLLLTLLIRNGVSIDASIVIVLAWLFVAGFGYIFPEAFTLMVWFVIGILAFLIFGELLRRGSA